MTKELKNIAVSVIGCEEASAISASDTVADPNATYALIDFKDEKYMKLKDRTNEGTTYFVPFHAVDHIIVTETEAEVADKNAYGCCPEGTVGGSTVGC